MTLPMDVRIASEKARFGFVFAKLGIVPEAASSWFLPRIVGIANALDLCLSGRIVDATEAQALASSGPSTRRTTCRRPPAPSRAALRRVRRPCRWR